MPAPTPVTLRSARAVRIAEAEAHFSTEYPGAEFAFGGSVAGALTLAHVRVRVEDRRGRSAEGWGAMFLSHPWAFPGAVPDGVTKDWLMRGLVETCGRRLAGSDLWGHPLDHFLAIEPKLPGIAAEVAADMGVGVPVPPLCALVACSPVDAAIHDAYGHLHGVPSFEALGARDLPWDLERILGREGRGRYPGDYLRAQPVPEVPISHTVGATDPLVPAETSTDGPIDLGAWIAREGVFSFKVKLKGQDLDWDVRRLVDVFRVAAESPGAAGPVRIFGDLNEQAPAVDYIAELLTAVEAWCPEAYAALDALEQPMPRDLTGSASLTAVSSRKPIVLDEGLTSLETIDQAAALGWNGVALKTCKTQSLMVLALPKATELGMAISVQDLTCPGIGLLQSVGFAARLPAIQPVETNQGQYFPHTSAPEAAVYPEIFAARRGRVPVSGLHGPGFGYGIERIDREIFRRS